LVGQPLGSEVSTRTGAHLGFAKVCVELKGAGTFPESIAIASKCCSETCIVVEYCNVPPVWKKCGCVGHDCSFLVISKRNPHEPVREIKVLVPKVNITVQCTKTVLALEVVPLEVTSPQVDLPNEVSTLSTVILKILSAVD
ncbi:hypothetical protein LINPERPRIM_LOCUS38792, partial [Linum perenne]